MGQNMEAVSQAVNGTTIKDSAETLFSYLDKGIDDMESGRDTLQTKHSRLYRKE